MAISSVGSVGKLDLQPLLSSTSCLQLHNVASVPHLLEQPLKACNRIKGFAQTTPLCATARTQRGHPHFQRSDKRQHFPQAHTPFIACDYLTSLDGPNYKCVATTLRLFRRFNKASKASKKVPRIRRILAHTQTRLVSSISCNNVYKVMRGFQVQSK